MQITKSNKVKELQVVLNSLPEDQKIDIESCTKHYFANQCYVREINIPAGTTFVGKIHLHECINILTKGTIAVADSNGNLQELTAPFTFVSPPNTQKAAYAITDIQWLNVHPNPTETKDLTLLETAVIQDPDRLIAY